MDLNDIQELIKFVAKSGATEVDLEIDNIKISIKSPAKKRRGTQDEAPMVIHQDLTQVPAAITTLPPTIVNTANTEKNEIVEEKTDHLLTVKSSMIGTFYRGSSPETPPFVSVGDEINIGDTICIIEAMKLFNEIESEVSGKIVKILVDDSTPIEFDQPLFLVDPS
jgi:acetyl-CoA carboxylase biotin carboxyl carrier protein|tara:strand:+ start:1548 stop:2045 length:498 start_codon:yes stop_codon:yes gene_type:complete